MNRFDGGQRAGGCCQRILQRKRGAATSVAARPRRGPSHGCNIRSLLRRTNEWTAGSLRFICLAIVAALAPDKASARRRSSSYGVQTGPAGIIFPSPSARARLVEPHLSTAAPALQDDVYSRWPFDCLWPTRFVSISGRSKLCPFSSRVTPKVARHPQASMVGLRGAGLTSFPHRLLRRLLAFRASGHLMNLWHAATQVALYRRARH